jgi:F-type H+-transporting ATPase subunit a
MMPRIVKWIGTAAALLALAGTPAAAQDAEHLVSDSLQTQLTPGAAAAAAQGEHPVQGEHGPSNQIDIMHHIGNASEVELPFGLGIWHLPQWEPLHIGGLELDLSPTKHLVFLLLSALLVGLVFLLAARGIGRAQRENRPAKGFAGAMEATALYIRQEVVLPNVGPHGEGFAPFLLTLFFFILTMNLLGLVPWGATATGNIAVTGALALLAFLVIEISGMRALGFKGYMSTIFYLPPGLPTALKPVMLVIMTPVEIIGKLSKPFALAVRLFANMTAGHVLVLALLGLTFIFQSYAVGVASAVLATGIMLLEVFVAFLQAFVFTLLTSVFIGLMRAEH